MLACLAIAGAFLAPTITIDPRLEALVPPDAIRSEALQHARDRYPADAPLYFVIQSDDPAVNRATARELFAEVESWPEVEFAMDRRDPTFFLERRLLYLDRATLADLADRVEDLVGWERCAAHPLCVSLTERPILSAEEVEAELLDSERLGELASLFVGVEAEELAATERERPPAEAIEPARAGDLCRPDGRVCVVQAHLRGDPSDFGYADRVAAEAQALLEGVRPADPPAGFDLRLEGRFSGLSERQGAVRRDLARTGALGLGLMLVVLGLQFRGRRAALLLAVPLLVGIGWTALAVALFAPPLNVVTAATLLIMAGLGVDFGVHLTTHFGEESESGAEVDGRLSATLRRLVPSLLLAAGTTSACFFALAMGRFAAFSQMGAVCALGILLTFAAFLLFFPTLARVGARAPGSTTRRLPLPAYSPPAAATRARVVSLLGLVVLALGALSTSQLEFEYDLGQLEAPPPQSEQARLAHGPAVPGTTRSPTLLLADDPAALRRAADGLRSMYPEGLLRDQPWLVTPSTFIPEDQEARLAEIRRARESVDSIWDELDASQRVRLQPLRPLLDVREPIRGDDLPRWVRHFFVERDGTFGRVGIVFTGGSANDGRDMAVRAQMLRDWHERFPDVHFASQAALLGEVTTSLKREAPRIVGLTILALVFGTLLIGRSLSRVALVLAPVLLSAAVCVLTMVLLDLRVHLYNLIVFPLAFGVGVDGAIFVVFRAMPTGARDVGWDGMGSSVRAILGSTLTTMAGFGALSISSNPGLASLGALSIVTLGATLVANLVWLPSVLAVLGARRARSD